MVIGLSENLSKNQYGQLLVDLASQNTRVLFAVCIGKLEAS
jgi:hypothetical protein